ALLVCDCALDNRPVDATRTTFFRILGDILKTPVDHRLEGIELLLRLSRRSFPTSPRRTSARSPVPPPSGVRALIPSIRRSRAGVDPSPGVTIIGSGCPLSPTGPSPVTADS